MLVQIDKVLLAGTCLYPQKRLFLALAEADPHFSLFYFTQSTNLITVKSLQITAKNKITWGVLAAIQKLVY